MEKKGREEGNSVIMEVMEWNVREGNGKGGRGRSRDPEQLSPLPLNPGYVVCTLVVQVVVITCFLNPKKSTRFIIFMSTSYNV